MIVNSGLQQALRTLKLSGMSQPWTRLAQARAGWPYRVSVGAVNDDISRRESQAITRRLCRAQFDQQVTLEEFDYQASPKLPAAEIRDLAALPWAVRGESVVLYGPVGVGKHVSHKDAAEDVPSSVELRWRSGEHQAALT